MAETYKPTQGMVDEAKRALEWISDGKAGQGFTDTGRKRASDIANGHELSADVVKRMYSFFKRHEVDKRATGFNAGEDGFPTPGRVAWSAWGGDAGYSWSTKIRNQIEAKDKMAKAKQTFVYSEILKMDEQPDGTLLVFGKATDDTLDSDEQICDPAWLAKAMPDWFKYGNIREQHSNIAAGVATEYKADGSEHFITAHVVDPSSVAKVKAGVLKGFSIGIRGARVAKDNKALGGRIVDGTIVEVSLVDRPANPACTLTMAKTIGSELTQVEELVEEKREVSDTERERLAEQGHAMPDGSYPIANTSDLENAIQSYGRAKDKEAVKEHIIQRAKDLDAVDLLPEDWNVGGKSMTATEIIATAKTIAGDVTKFDQAAFDQARAGLAALITVEAAELAEGSDESASLACLLLAVHALFEFHDGEAAEGEVPAIPETDGDADIDNEAEIELADAPDVEMCDKCNKEMKECKCAEGGYSQSEVKEDSADVCADCGKAEDECTCEADKAAKKEAKKMAKQNELRELITEVVKSLLSPEEEVSEDETKSLDSDRIEALEAELEMVKSLAAPSSVKRLGSVSSKSTVDINKSKAQEYRAKAMATTDTTLAQGYLAMARELDNN